MYTLNIDVNTTSTPDSLMIDTGANFTVFNNVACFMRFNPPTTHSFICFGPSAKFSSEGEGSMHFFITDFDSVTHSVYMTHVMYMPTQPHNIVSLKSLQQMRSGVNFDFPPYHIRWHIEDADYFQHLYFSENFPYARITPPPQVNSVKQVQAGTDMHIYTHARLGHTSSQKVKILQHAGLLKDIDKFNSHPVNCEICIWANAELDPYPSRTGIQATHPNHTLDAGLLDVPKAGPFRYLLWVLDEHTRYAFSRLLKTKGQAAEAVLCIMKRAQLLHQHHIKYIHTDQGGAFSSTVLRIAIEELGIAPQVLPARCHHSNGLIERLNRTIQEKIRTFLIASCLPDLLWGEAAIYATHV
jgi:hypothetical protein